MFKEVLDSHDVGDSWLTKFQSPFLKGVGVPFIVLIVGGKLIGPKLVRFLPDVSWNGKPSVSPRLPQDPIVVIQAPLLGT